MGYSRRRRRPLEVAHRPLPHVKQRPRCEPEQRIVTKLFQQRSHVVGSTPFHEGPGNEELREHGPPVGSLVRKHQRRVGGYAEPPGRCRNDTARDERVESATAYDRQMSEARTDRPFLVKSHTPDGKVDLRSAPIGNPCVEPRVLYAGLAGRVIARPVARGRVRREALVSLAQRTRGGTRPS